MYAGRSGTGRGRIGYALAGLAVAAALTAGCGIFGGGQPQPTPTPAATAQPAARPAQPTPLPEPSPTPEPTFTPTPTATATPQPLEGVVGVVDTEPMYFKGEEGQGIGFLNWKTPKMSRLEMVVKTVTDERAPLTLEEGEPGKRGGGFTQHFLSYIAKVIQTYMETYPGGGKVCVYAPGVKNGMVQSEGGLRVGFLEDVLPGQSITGDTRLSAQQCERYFRRKAGEG